MFRVGRGSDTKEVDNTKELGNIVQSPKKTSTLPELTRLLQLMPMTTLLHRLLASPLSSKPHFQPTPNILILISIPEHIRPLLLVPGFP